MATQVQNRRGTTAEHSTFTGAVGELTVDTTKDTVVVHDGAVAGGRPLLREDQSNLPTSAPTTGIYNASGSLAISTGGSGRLFVDASGNVILGTTSILSGASGRVLQIGTTTDTASTLQFAATTTGNSYIQFGDGGSPESYAGYLQYTHTDNALLFGTNKQERLRITSAGLVGLGTSSPQNFFHLRSDANSAVTHLYLMNRTSGASVESRIAFTTSANDLSDNRHAYIGAVTTGAGQNGNSFVIATNPNGGSAQTRVFVSSTGNVGVGTTSPGAVLHSAVSSGAVVFRGSHNNTGLDLYANDASGEARITASRLGGSGGKFLSFYTDTGTGEFERARIDSSGRLLVGTSSQSGGALLQVNGDRVRIATAKTPASATDTGTAGEICWDASYVYVCTATNTWKRSALSTW